MFRSVMPHAAVATLCVMGVAAVVGAGEYNPVLSPGDPAPAYGGLPGIDGRTYALADPGNVVAVIAFTCNDCPYAKDAEARLKALTTGYAGQPVAVIAINCNTGKAESIERMKAIAAERGITYTYLKDEVGLTGKAFGATRTPELFVIGRDNKIIYQGALDDSPAGDKVTRRYVEEAVTATLAGKTPAVAETPPIGCLIKYDRRK